MFWIIFSVLWIACAIVNWGLVFAFYQREYPSLAEEGAGSDRLCAATTSLLGPISLLGFILFLASNGYKPHGLKF